MINFRLTWHPQFSICNLENGDALFLGDGSQFLVDSTTFAGINPVVANQGQLSDYVFGCHDVAEQVARMEEVDRLLADNILLARKDVLRPHPPYSIPDFRQDIKELAADGKHAYLLSSLTDETTLKAWLARLGLPPQARLVIVDDYLDPRLANMAEAFRQQGTGWMLIKPTGLTPMAGPYFNRHDDSAPCYHCLHSRLLQNTPVREWYRRQVNGETPVAVPIYHDESATLRALDNFSQYYFNQPAFPDGLQPGLYSIDSQDEAAQKKGRHHPLLKRPQCRTCGNPGFYEQINNVPVRLSDSPKHSDPDGGYRTLAREETVAHINQLISPVSGIITELRQLSGDTDTQAIAIYQAAYFQTAYGNKAVTPDTFVQLSLGKGVSRQQAMSSALGEALERQAAQYVGDESFCHALPAELAHRAFPPQQLTPFSQRQYQAFGKHAAVSPDDPQWVIEYSPDIPLHWVRGWSLSNGEFVYFPAAHCFANTPFDDHVYSLYTHNGNAAGNTQEEAILQGTLELIERDAAAIWWYNQIPRPAIDLAVVNREARRIISHTLDEDWDYWLLDISNDIEAISCVAVGRHRQDNSFVLGFGCHLEVAIACQRALTEMHQLITIKDKVTGPFDFNRIPSHPFLFPRRNTTPKRGEDFRTFDTPNIKDDILYLLEILQKVGLELCVLNYSRPDIPLKTLKVIVPGLCHFWPQLANPRLYDVPVRLDWLSRPLQEQQLNPLDLYL